MLEDNIKSQADSDFRKVYKIGGSIIWKLKLLGSALFFVFVLYFTTDAFLSNDTEWHLYSTKWGPVIPNIYIKSIWYIMLASSIFGLIVSFIPHSNIIIDKDKISVQGFYTRKFKTAPLSEIVDIKTNSYAIKLFSLNNGNLQIPINMITKKDFIDLRNRIYNSTNLI